jgi:GNAT superfamily N-acetyltransferase
MDLGDDTGAQRMAISIRRLGPGDEGVLEGLAHEADDFDLAGASAPEPPLAPDEAAAYLTDPSVLHWVAEEEGVLVGELLCHVLRLPSGTGRELLLYAIGVRAAYRRRGIGAALVAGMLHWAGEAGIPEVWVLADNPGAEAFYAACGFARGGEGEQGVLMLRQVAGDAGRQVLPRYTRGR